MRENTLALCLRSAAAAAAAAAAADAVEEEEAGLADAVVVSVEGGGFAEDESERCRFWRCC